MEELPRLRIDYMHPAVAISHPELMETADLQDAVRSRYGVLASKADELALADRAQQRIVPSVDAVDLIIRAIGQIKGLAWVIHPADIETRQCNAGNWDHRDRAISAALFGCSRSRANQQERCADN
jgi:hypothetical protein